MGLSETRLKVKKTDGSTGESSFPLLKATLFGATIPFSETFRDLNLRLWPPGSHRCPKQSRDQGRDQRLLMAPPQVTLQKILRGPCWSLAIAAMSRALGNPSKWRYSMIQPCLYSWMCILDYTSILGNLGGVFIGSKSIYKHGYTAIHIASTCSNKCSKDDEAENHCVMETWTIA
jgi:hypothetical protein